MSIAASPLVSSAFFSASAVTSGFFSFSGEMALIVAGSMSRIERDLVWQTFGDF